MLNVKRVLWVLASAALAAPPQVHAQAVSPATQKFFVNANVGGQLTSSSNLERTVSRTIYEEPATLTVALPINTGLLGDIEFGYRIFGDFYAALGISVTASESDAEATASIPDPIFFGRPKIVTRSEPGLKRQETAYNPHAVWAFALSDKFDIAVGLGASIIQLSQEVVSDFTVPPPTQTPTFSRTTEKATAKGVYAQADLIYNLMTHMGVGGFVRYAGGKADLESVGVTDHKVGGAQAGGGVRFKF